MHRKSFRARFGIERVSEGGQSTKQHFVSHVSHYFPHRGKPDSLLCAICEKWRFRARNIRHKSTSVTLEMDKTHECRIFDRSGREKAVATVLGIKIPSRSFFAPIPERPSDFFSEFPSVSHFDRNDRGLFPAHVSRGLFSPSLKDGKKPKCFLQIPDRHTIWGQ